MINTAASLDPNWRRRGQVRRIGLVKLVSVDIEGYWLRVRPPGDMMGPGQHRRRACFNGRLTQIHYNNENSSQDIDVEVEPRDTEVNVEGANAEIEGPASGFRPSTG